MFQHCFVTVGTTRFDGLCTVILSPAVRRALARIGVKRVTLQLGNSDLEPAKFDEDGISFELYRFKDSIQEDIRSADLVISHAGAGSCLEVLELGKPLLVVVNEELMDNHQLELAEQLQIQGHVYYCTSDTLDVTLDEVDFKLLVPFPKPDPTMFVKYLDSVLRVKRKSGIVEK